MTVADPRTHVHWSLPSRKHCSVSASLATHSFALAAASSSLQAAAGPAWSGHSAFATWAQHPPRHALTAGAALIHVHWSLPSRRHCSVSMSVATHSFALAAASSSLHAAPPSAGSSSSSAGGSSVLSAAGSEAPHTAVLTRSQQSPRQSATAGASVMHVHWSLPSRKHCSVSALAATHSFVFAVASASLHFAGSKSASTSPSLEHRVASTRSQHPPRHAKTVAEFCTHSHWSPPSRKHCTTSASLVIHSPVFAAA